MTDLKHTHLKLEIEYEFSYPFRLRLHGNYRKPCISKDVDCLFFLDNDVLTEYIDGLINVIHIQQKLVLVEEISEDYTHGR